MKVVVDYPNPAEEVEIVQRMGTKPPAPENILNLEDLGELQEAANELYVDRGVVDYAVSLTVATREPAAYHLADLEELIAYGASPRASLGLIAAGRSLALLRGRGCIFRSASH